MFLFGLCWSRSLEKKEQMGEIVNMSVMIIHERLGLLIARDAY